jgi:hypothetical protein
MEALREGGSFFADDNPAGHRQIINRASLLMH